MNATPRPDRAGDAEDPGNELPPSPDEDGPHDVPDDQVIEATLPATPPPGKDKDRGRRP